MSNPLITAGLSNGSGPVDNGSPQFSTAVVVDGTPMRVAAIGVAAALALYALRWAGFKFNVGVS